MRYAFVGVCVVLGVMCMGSIHAQAAPPCTAGCTGDTETCANGIIFNLDFLSGQISLRFALPVSFWQSWFAGDGETANVTCHRNPICPQRSCAFPSEDLPPQAQQARTLFDIGQRCLASGDVDKARTCFEEVHLLAPESSWGRQAIQRLADMDNVPAATADVGGEEQDRGTTLPRRTR